MSQTKPNNSEFLFLHHSYNFFLDILEETKDDSFFQKDSYYRFNRIKDAFLVYSEVLEYEPMNWFLEALKKFRPPMEVEMSKDFILFIRNLLIHFPYFKSWNEVRVSKDLVNWSKPARSIDKFLSRVAGKDEFKCRIWDAQKKTMTYCAVKFPKAYENDGTEIYLKDMLSEKEGITFCMSIMFRVLASQVESITS